MARPEKALPQNLYTYRYIAVYGTRYTLKNIAPPSESAGYRTLGNTEGPRQHIGSGVVALYRDITIKCDATELGAITSASPWIIGQNLGAEYRLDESAIDPKTGEYM